MITTVVLVILYLISLFVILKFPALRKILNSSPITVVKNGEILTEGLNKARISIDVLLGIALFLYVKNTFSNLQQLEYQKYQLLYFQ